MEFVPAVAFVTLVYKVVDTLRYAKSGDINGVLTQVIAWVSGVAVAFLVAQTEWADGIEIGDRPLSRLGFWSLVFAGLTIGSAASTAKDLFKSVDNANTSKIPTLLPAGPKKVRRVTRGNSTTEDVG